METHHICILASETLLPFGNGMNLKAQALSHRPLQYTNNTQLLHQTEADQSSATYGQNLHNFWNASVSSQSGSLLHQVVPSLVQQPLVSLMSDVNGNYPTSSQSRLHTMNSQPNVWPVRQSHVQATSHSVGQQLKPSEVMSGRTPPLPSRQAAHPVPYQVRFHFADQGVRRSGDRNVSDHPRGQIGNISVLQEPNSHISLLPNQFAVSLQTQPG